MTIKIDKRTLPAKTIPRRTVREHSLLVRLSHAERELVHAAAARADVPTAQWVRHQLLTAAKAPPQDPVDT